MNAPGDVLPGPRPASRLAAAPVGLPRLLPPRPGAGPVGLAEHLDRFGPIRRRLDEAAADGLIAEVRRAGLTGRGGAAFPAARKLAAVATAQGRSLVVANGTEGEPASAKDKVLAATQPHLILDGAALAAGVTGARHAFIVADYSVAPVMEQAVAEREAARLDSCKLRVVTAADGFVAGEASAVVQWIERGTAVPMAAPPRLAQRGLHCQPTLVQNVETLAHIALIARYGADWFRAVGTPAEPGSMLVTVTGAVRLPSVHEVEIGCQAGAALDLAGGPAGQIAGLLIGGYGGSWVSWPASAVLPLSAAGLARAGASPGAGLIAALPAGVCPLAETASIVRYLAAQSAGQCGPCLFGLAAISRDLAALADSGRSDLRRLRRWLSQVTGRGACKHPDGAARMIASALAVFGAEVDQHLAGWCSAPGTEPAFPVPPRRRPR